MLTRAEESYLKIIFHLEEEKEGRVLTKAIAEGMQTKPSSATDMVQKLAEKNLVIYERYKGTNLTEKGIRIAANIIRKHRLWEVFLVKKLLFEWDEVHEIAGQLEHIQSEELISRLDDFLGNPDFDPHGDPIPDAKGHIKKTSKKLLSELNKGEGGICVGVKESAPEFLQYLNKKNIAIGTRITVMGKEFFDDSMIIQVGNENSFISSKIAQNLFIKTV